ncbi:LysR family transcriptional regulator [Dactylosporangium sp. CA-092794]|uniref:LysR family transcriptional regulator n=1 Tax=Dactylosporangium sp. CA-092794 TaxID=3239929 RepID=UPI003D8A7407
MLDFDLRQLRYLVAVADEGSFTQAADLLGVTQSALSRSVATLEATLGVALFERLARGVVPTAAGEVMVCEARTIVRRAETAVARARRAAVEKPPIRFSARGCDLALADELVRNHERCYAADGIELVDADWHSQLDDLRKGVTQLALICGDFDPGGTDHEVLRSYERLAVVADSNPLASRRVVDRTELLPYPVLTWAGDDAAARAYWLGGPDAIPGPEVNDGEKMVAHVRLGHCIVFLPRPYMEHHGQPAGVAVLQVRDLSPGLLRLVWAEQETSLAVARFVGHAVRSTSQHSESV